MVGKRTQLLDFRCREEVPRELRVIRLRPDVFEIDADVGLSGDGDEGKTGGVREVELEPAAEPGAEVRLAECLVHKAYSARFGLEIVPQEITQHSARDDEMPTIALESETCAPVAFVNREGRVEASRCLRRNVQAGAPNMHFVGRHSRRARQRGRACRVWPGHRWLRCCGRGHRHVPGTSIVSEQSARCTASAIATSTSRGPWKGSLPWAVRMLSTSIRSPDCHDSRTVFAS